MTERDTEPTVTVSGAEVPVEDAAEQQRLAADTEDGDDEVTEVPVDADPADRVEQARVVPLDDDDYR